MLPIFARAEQVFKLVAIAGTSDNGSTAVSGIQFEF
jgi:hypothetical protein